MAENTENWTKLESDSRYPRKYQFEELENKVDNFQPLQSFVYKDTVADYDALSSLTGLEVGDGYVNAEDGLVYVWNGNSFPAEGEGLDVAMKPIGKVEQENSFAVSGGEVYQYINKDVSSLLYENKIFSSQHDNQLVNNPSYDVYLVKVNKDDSLDISSYWGNSSGVNFGLIGFSFLGDSIDAWLFSSDQPVSYDKQNVIVPDNGFLIINVRKGLPLPFLVKFVTNNPLIYRSDITDNAEVNDPKIPVASSVTAVLNAKLKYFGIKQEMLTDNVNPTNSLASHFRFIGYENRIFANKRITQVIIDVQTSGAGTFSVLKIKNRGSNDVEVVEKQTFDVVDGKNNLQTSIFIDSNTDLAFLDITDTALVRYINGAGPDPNGGRFYAFSTDTNNWGFHNTDLNIAVTATSSDTLDPLFKEENSLLSEKTFSILGDSISTFLGYIVSGNNNYYPRLETVPDITNVDQTYWGRLIKNDGMVLNVNNSSSGSQVVSTSGVLSFYNRVANLGANSDFIFLFGGTNDWLNSVPLGNSDFSVPIDNTTFIGCYRYVLEYILENHPTSRLIVFIPMHRRTSADTFPSVNGSGVSIQEYQQKVIEMCEYYGVDYLRTDFVQTNFNWETYSGEGTHPNDKGMEMIYRLLKSKLITYLNN